MSAGRSRAEPRHYAVLIAALFAMVLSVFFAHVAAASFTSSTRLNWALAALAVLLGFAFGALMGALASPGPEDKTFSEYTKAISAFVSGVLVAKVGTLMDQWVAGDSKATAAFLITAAVGGIGLVAGMFVVYMIRTDVFPVRERGSAADNEQSRST